MTKFASGIMAVSRKGSFVCPAQDTHCIRVLGSFLWADATRGALQVFLPQQFLAVENPGGVIREEGLEEGTWITADPIPGCIVCNIGESTWSVYPLVIDA